MTAVARMTSAKKKPKAQQPPENQGVLNLGEVEPPVDDDRVDIGAADEALEDLMDE